MKSARVLVMGAVVALAATPGAAWAATTPGDAPPPPDLVALLDGFAGYWQSDGTDDLHGTVLDPVVLATNDERVTWINGNATPAQQFAALQDAQYGESPDAYDQSITISTGLGSLLGPLYVEGRQSGALPLTSALLASTGGSAGDFVSTDVAKETYSFLRPFVPTDPSTPSGPPNGPDCDPAEVNASSLEAVRAGRPYADADGDLDIVRVADATDDTGEFTDATVTLSVGYDDLCRSGSFPSGHTTTAYQAGVTLATMLPELAPEILTRASENGNDRLVLGVHSPLDIMGGRISGHAAIATLWSDAAFRSATLEPAIAELRSYLEARCGGTIASCAVAGEPYANDPYGGAAMPGGTAQIVTDRATGLAAYAERMTYGFAASGTTGLAPAVPAGAENLLLTTFPTLTDAQRIAVLEQTQIDSGYPLDLTASGSGSWQRVDLAAATSATVQLSADGAATVTATGGEATVVPAAGPTPTPTPTPAPSVGQCLPEQSIAEGISLTCLVQPESSGADQPLPGTRIHWSDVDLSAPGVAPRIVQSNDRIFQPVPAIPAPPSDRVNETVSSMANRTTGAVVGVNGGYFDNDKGPQSTGYTATFTGVPCGGVVIDGRILRSPSDDPMLNASVFASADGTMAIGQVSFDGEIRATPAAGGAIVTTPLTSINDLGSAFPQPNCPRALQPGQTAGDGITLVTPDMGEVLLQEGSEAEGDPGYAVPATTTVLQVTARAEGGADRYVVEGLASSEGLSSIAAVAPGTVVLVGSSFGGAEFLRMLAIGDVLEIPTALAVGTGDDAHALAEGITSLVGGVAQVGADGAVVPEGDVQGYTPRGSNAETLIGLDETGTRVTLVVVDKDAVSPGVTWQEAAQAALDREGVSDVLLMDGGGSSTLVAQLPTPAVAADGQTSRVTVVNTPANDGNYPEGSFTQRLVGNGLFFTGTVAGSGPAPVPAGRLPATGGPGPGIGATAGVVLLLAGSTLALWRARRGRAGSSA